MRIFKQLFAAIVTVLGLATLPAQAATILFQDNFETDNTSSVLNFNAFNNWTVSEGTVDYIRSGGFGIGCVGGIGGCVDLDGSTGDGGRMTSKSTFNFITSETYRLSLDFSGNQRGGAQDQFTYGVFVMFSATYSNIAATEPFFASVFTISGFSGMAQFFIETSSNDNVGVIVDNVRLECLTCQPNNVPEPSTLALLGLGLLGFRLARKRD